MPLLDHFAQPLCQTHPWRGFNSAWASSIARHLNRGVLPTGFYAIPNVELDSPIEIDVAMLRELQTESGTEGEEPALWSPPEPALAVALEFPPLNYVEVQVLFDEASPRLIAAIELVSPSNKDRPSERRAFAVKCASYLQQGSSVVIVDPVTVRKANLHVELLRVLDLDVEHWQSPSGLYAGAYRAPKGETQTQFQAWLAELSLGSPLPTLPLWLGVDVSVRLDLDVTYQATCEDLRIRQAG